MNTNALVLAAALIGAGLINTTPAAAAKPSAPDDKPSATAEKPAAAPAAGAKEAPSAPPAAAPASASADSSNSDNQTDETAGKNVDLEKIATSPKEGSPYLGPKDAPVVVNIFSDFQCPVCRRSADPIKQLVADYPGKVKVVFRNNALEMHGRARPAALAALAAGKQGKFWQYHDRLFANQRALDDASLRRNAEALGLDMDQWSKDIADPKNLERVTEESAWANKLGAAGTPALFVNGSRQVGWGSYQGLKSMVAREVSMLNELPAAAPARKSFTAERIRTLADKTKKDGESAPDQEEWVRILTAD